MAKTRSQTRKKEAPPSLKMPLKQNKTKQKKKCQNLPAIRDCFVLLERIEPKEMSSDASKAQKKYNLRKQASYKIEEVKKIAKQVKPSLIKTVALTQSALHTSRAARMWEQKKKKTLMHW